VSEEKKVTLEMSVYQAAAVRASLFTDTKEYTYDPKCVPERVTQIREAIVEIDNQLEEILNEETDS
tara:strand:- start:469 stop:666 length:198 start_codon:yes stop_codon:yes gene_type:complete